MQSSLSFLSSSSLLPRSQTRWVCSLESASNTIKNPALYCIVYFAPGPKRVQIFQKASGKLNAPEIIQKSSGPLMISAQPIRKLPFTLSWSHYVELLGVKDPGERSFYEIEASNEG